MGNNHDKWAVLATTRDNPGDASNLDRYTGRRGHDPGDQGHHINHPGEDP